MSKTLTELKKERLKIAIKHRQNLVNHFETFLSNKYKSKHPKINLEDQKVVENYFALTGAKLESIKNYFADTGTIWQKRRLTTVFTRGKYEMDI